MFCRIPAAKRLETACEIVFSACYISMRRGDSCFVYHDDVIRETAGTKRLSVRPTKNRQSKNPQPAVIAGIQMVVADYPSIQHGNKIRGFLLAIMTLAETCEMMYST